MTRKIFIQFILALIILGFVALTARVVYINKKYGKVLRQMAIRQHRAFRPIPAVRGTIYDRKGRILAGTKIVPSLFADPAIIEDKISAADILSAITQISPESIVMKLQSKPNARFIWLKRDINPDIAESIRKLNLRGIGIINESKRVYPAGTLAGHILGSVNIDGKGIEGIELFYNKILQGRNGTETYMRDAAGRKIWLIKKDSKPPVNGKNIILTIDSVIQQFTQETLAETTQHYHAESGIAIVMDPKTGDVLALACYPLIDPNRFGKYPVARRRDRAITDPFEPGSVFKPFIASFALQEKVVTWNEKIFCHNGAYTIGRRILHDHTPHGDLTFPEIVIVSSNIGMGIIGQRMGNRRLYHAITSFGFGEKTLIDLPGEDAGILRPLKKWNDYSTTSLPMGQEIAVTGIQLIRAFAAIANHGLMLKPRIMRACVDETGKILGEHTKPEPVREVIKPEIADIMVQNVLRRVVTEGTAKRANLKGYMVFGKTGTAQIARKDGHGYQHNAYVASFVGGAPSYNPKLVALVSIRRPERKIGHFGGTVSAPAVKIILKKCFDYLHDGPFEKEDKVEKIKVKK